MHKRGKVHFSVDECSETGSTVAMRVGRYLLAVCNYLLLSTGASQFEECGRKLMRGKRCCYLEGNDIFA